MFIERPLRKGLYISLLGHLTVLTVFSLSFGRILSHAGGNSFSYWGQVLPIHQTALIFQLGQRTNQGLPHQAPYPVTIKQLRPGYAPSMREYYLKPQMAMGLISRKVQFIDKSVTTAFIAKRKEPEIIFHPLLPYSFSLYFRDRQIAHVEMMFNIQPQGPVNLISIKRKISSGNLEVDLLSMRYISRYLFIQQAGFTPNLWQAVKIDLSAKDR